MDLIKQESSSLIEGSKRKYELPIISARQNSLMVATRNDQTTIEFCIMVFPLLQLLLLAFIMLLLSTALFFAEATELEITEREILLSMHLIDAVNEQEQKHEQDQDQGEQNFELNTGNTEDNVVTAPNNFSLLITNETSTSKNSLRFNNLTNETLINKLFNYLKVYENENEQIIKMEKKRPKRIEKAKLVNGSEDQTIIKNDQLNKNKKSRTNENHENCQMLLMNNNHSSTEILFCGNESEYCFHMDSKCNGVSDCPNGYDESVELCGCMEHEFQCNQTCIDAILIRCDTKTDCLNGTDEHGCETYVCPETHFKCNNHYCIPAENVCDFQNNCGDNSDEEACSHRTCWFGEYKCDNGQCIQAYGVCNGQNDCVDGSDELQCNPMDFVTCNGSGIRVHRSLWCDGRPDCLVNHEDELGCSETCAKNEFRCSNTRCIPLGNQCDTICDCAQTCEDELNCDQYYTKINGVNYCSPTKTISCSLSDNGKYIDRCLNNEYVCNGFNDCPKLFDDEYGCPYGGYTEEVCQTMKDHFWCSIENRCLPISIRCNYIQECFDAFDELDCNATKAPCSVNEFRCNNGQCISIEQRCDSLFDCYDKSDEINCTEHRCPSNTLRCHSGQCIPADRWCDYFFDCIDQSDELYCETSNKNLYDKNILIFIDGQHHLSTNNQNRTSCDSEKHFRCDNGQCIPKEYRCLLTEDTRQICADRSNLNGCSNFTCQHSNSIKCAGSFCVQQSLKCNERLDCPVLSDWADEQFCPFYCSESKSCRCIDTTINCSNQSLTEIPNSIEDQILRMILKGNHLGHNLTLDMFNRFDRMHMIDLSENQIQYIPPGLFRKLWKLRILHLRKNLIEIISSYTFSGLPNVGTLSLNGNRIRSIDEHAFSGLASLKTLDLSNQRIASLPKNSFSGLRSLKNLDLSNNQITELHDGVFARLSSLISIDLRGNHIKNVGSKTFQGLNSLKQITFDEFRFCCLARHVENCYPPPNEFSSCEDLMSNTILRICIWCLGSIALIGNIFVILWRIRYQTINRVHSFLIINLALGDLLMGIYLMIIASVDSYYRGIYFIVDAGWRQSLLCHFAGFLSTLSSEFSVFALIVITLDRLITITFPFGIYRIHSKKAKWIIGAAWLIAIVLAGLPLSSLRYFDNYYGRSGVCLALHITHERPNGWEYSVFIFLVLNLLSFTLICCSYLWMFIVVKNTRMAAPVRQYISNKTKNSSSLATSAATSTVATSQETRVQNRMARRMMFIVMTDFFCWMPIITLGIVSLFGVRIPPQVFAWIAVFVLPLNAAVNPTLYTLSGLSFGKSHSINTATTLSINDNLNRPVAVRTTGRKVPSPSFNINYNLNHIVVSKSNSTPTPTSTFRLTNSSLIENYHQLNIDRKSFSNSNNFFYNENNPQLCDKSLQLMLTNGRNNSNRNNNNRCEKRTSYL